MPNTIDRTHLIIRETTVRMTPPPAGRQFRDALVQSGRAVLEGAVNAAAYLPGGPLVAAAVRGAVLPALQPLVQGRTASSAELPSGSTSASVGATRDVGGGIGMSGGASIGSSGGSVGGASALPVDPGAAGATGGGATGGASGSTGNDDMLARGQEMSMQMLRLQEAMGEENRRYTALSNVLHARHEMAKNAIGNIR